MQIPSSNLASRLERLPKSVKERGTSGFVHLPPSTEKGRDELKSMEREHTCVCGLHAHAHTYIHINTHRLSEENHYYQHQEERQSVRPVGARQAPGLGSGKGKANYCSVSGDLGEQELQL